MTGWRLGAAVGPAPIIDAIAKLNVNDESCANHFVQCGALEGLTGDQSEPREIVSGLMARKGLASYDELRRAALEETGVYFCTRLHFGRALPGEKEACVRFAYSGIPVTLIEEGLGRQKAWAEA